MSRPLRYLIEHGFEGEIYPINPGYQELEGKVCYPTLLDAPGPIDLVLILLPARGAVEAIEQAGAVGAAAAIVFASGFAEAGPEGTALQNDLVEAGLRTGVRILGPNCQGLFYAPAGLAATFTAAADRPMMPLRGVAYVGQSGAIGGSVLDLATEMGLGLTAWASTGNQADLGFVDIALALLNDPAVTVLMLYVEAIPHGRAYAQMLRLAAERRKRVVVLTSGTSTVGRKAAASHTGSMLGNDAGFVLTSREFGAILVEDVDELLTVAATLAVMERPNGRKVAIVTTSGGAGSLAADLLCKRELALDELDGATQLKLRNHVPSFGTVNNPVDVTAKLFDGGPEAFGEVCRVVAEDPGVDAVAVILTMVVGQPAARLAETLVATANSMSKPLLIAWLAGRDLTVEGRAVFQRAGLPIFNTVDALARASAHLAPPQRFEPRRPLTPTSSISAAPVSRLFEAGAAADGRPLLDVLDIRQPRFVRARSASEAKDAVQAFGGQAAMKLDSADLHHKTELGGVRLGVTAAAAEEAYEELRTVASEQLPGASGVLVQEMIPAGTELVIGVSVGKDGYPPILTVGLGGVTTELYRDLAFALAPVTALRAWSMLRSLKAWPLLVGFRGAPPRDIDAAVNAIVRLGQFADIPGTNFAEFEINPLIVAPAGGGAVAVDVLLTTTNPISASST